VCSQRGSLANSKPIRQAGKNQQQTEKTRDAPYYYKCYALTH